MSPPIPKRSKKNNRRARTGKKGRYKNQDKHRWRKVATALLSVAFFVPFTTVFYLHGPGFVWSVVASVALLLALILVLLEWHVWKQGSAWARFCLICFCGLLSVGGFMWQSRIEKLSPPHRPWLRFTDEERRRFIATLAAQTEPRERVRIGCPAANEDICVLATPFVDAFKRGHFIVENDRVDRVTLSKPAAGVVLFKYGHADAFDPQDPNQGKWTEITKSLETVESAFGEIGINSRIMSDETIPKDVIGVYFGIEPYEPVERDDLRKLRREAEEQSSQKPSP